MGHAQLFRGVHAATGRLLAVTQGGIEEENPVLAVLLLIGESLVHGSAASASC
jgi:hypothetical protein